MQAWVNYGKPMTKSFEVKRAMTDKTPRPMSPAVKKLLLVLLAIGCFPAFLIYIFREPLKEFFWEIAMSSSKRSSSDTNTSDRSCANHSGEESTRKFVFTDGKGNMSESGCVFYDFRGNLCEWGSPFYDANGDLIDPR